MKRRRSRGRSRRGTARSTDGRRADRSPKYPEWKRGVISGDDHYADHDPLAIELFEKVSHDVAPHVSIKNGDGIDWEILSRFPKNRPVPYDEFDTDLDAFIVGLESQMQNVGGSTRWVYNGDDNHVSGRLIRFQLNDAQVYSRRLAPARLMELDRLGVEYVPSGRIYVGDGPGRYLILHGYVARSYPGDSAWAMSEKEGCSIITGHVHRSADLAVRTPTRTLQLIEVGLLGNLIPRYRPNRAVNWHQGMAVFEYKPGGPMHVDVIRFYEDDGALTAFSAGGVWRVEKPGYLDRSLDLDRPGRGPSDPLSEPRSPVPQEDYPLPSIRPVELRGRSTRDRPPSTSRS